nr:glycoside hydrolase family 15 protein [Streptomyces xantholiticus]
MHASQLTHPHLNVLYRLDGGHRTPERSLPWEGYRGSGPVRIGNAAVGQVQLDTYGELLQTAWQYALATGRLDADIAHRLAELADFVCATWQEPDAGIWEVRTAPALHPVENDVLGGTRPRRRPRRTRSDPRPALPPLADHTQPDPRLRRDALLLTGPQQLRTLRRQRGPGRRRPPGPLVRIRWRRSSHAGHDQHPGPPSAARALRRPVLGRRRPQRRRRSVPAPRGEPLRAPSSAHSR